MRRFVSSYGWMMIAVLLLSGCDDEQRIVNGNEPVDDDGYELLDDVYAGTEALAVSFEADPNSSVGVPTILVAPESDTVIGYLPGE